MGTLNVTGYAERECILDVMTITICFYDYADSSSAAIQSVLTQSEAFLADLHAKGIKLSDLHVGKNNVEQDDNRLVGGKSLVTAFREIVIRTAFNMPFFNFLMEQLGRERYNVSVQTDYDLSNSKEIHDDLLKEAMADARQKAVAVAESMNQKIVGIETIELRKRRWDEKDVPLKDKTDVYTVSSMPYSDEVFAKMVVEWESVEVQWKIE